MSDLKAKMHLILFPIWLLNPTLYSKMAHCRICHRLLTLVLFLQVDCFYVKETQVKYVKMFSEIVKFY